MEPVMRYLGLFASALPGAQPCMMLTEGNHGSEAMDQCATMIAEQFPAFDWTHDHGLAGNFVAWAVGPKWLLMVISFDLVISSLAHEADILCAVRRAEHEFDHAADLASTPIKGRA
jgi:hypothetical protein